MDNHRILITGDYWHSDFRDVLTHLKVPTTLVPADNLQACTMPGDVFELVVLAQARRDQFANTEIEFLQDRFPLTPIIALLGSWCEGELRSGHVVPGLIRIYWHQWQGRYDSFAEQANSSDLSTWHLPRIANPVDRVVQHCQRLAEELDGIAPAQDNQIVGVSAWTRDGFEMISDALTNLGYPCDWLEDDTLRGTESRQPSVICINADSLSANLQANIMELRSRFPEIPIVIILNFPRKFELDSARQLGVCEIVSKPYELIDLKFALERALRMPTRVESDVAGAAVHYLSR